MTEKFTLNKEHKTGSVLGDNEKLLTLFRKLENVYKNRPDIDNFVGAMSGTKFEDEYTKEVIDNDKEYAERMRAKMDEENSSMGRENLDYLEGGFQLSEILQAMVVDRLNKNWFKEIQAIMTSDFDDIASGIDAVLKDKNGKYLGLSVDFSITYQDNIILKKLKNEWEKFTQKGKVRAVKYFEDPDTKEKGKLLVPKFIIGASKKDVEELANAYLSDDKETLDNHPLKYLILLQMEEQLQTALDYYEVNSDDRSLDFSKKQYERIQTTIRKMKNEVHIDENMHKDVDIHAYTKESVALDAMRRFRIMKEIGL